MKPIRKLLIANRGEISCRIIRTCQQLGIATVAVYSEIDAHAMHVRLADESVCIGGASAGESYLNGKRILEAAIATGADAIHPGYGFLSENPEFAEACAKSNIKFVGPPAKAMRQMALKGEAKNLMEAAGVPIVPGYAGDAQDDDILCQEAERIGFPVLVKAVAGGGGKGMRAAHHTSEILDAIQSAKREGQNAFGNSAVLIEKLIEKPRHIELQVMADQHGNIVHLFERDCSIQRRHQKVIEEAPAPDMPQALRQAMGEAAVEAARAISYEGAGTVEFIVDVAGGLEEAPFYFMEMNTRLQVEHPVTEMILDEDLVEWQIRIAEGHHLPLSQDEILLGADGHAIEARLYAENPEKDFMPAVGRIGLFDPTHVPIAGGRIDSGVCAGDNISIHYDPMLAKIIAWGEDRSEAIHRLTRLLGETAISNVASNRDFLMRVLQCEAFKAADLDTGFIGRHESELLQSPPVEPRHFMLAALAIIADRLSVPTTQDSPWQAQDYFRLNRSGREYLYFKSEANEVSVKVEQPSQNDTQNYTMTCHGETASLALTGYANGRVAYASHGYSGYFYADVTGQRVTLIDAQTTWVLERCDAALSGDEVASGAGLIRAPMPGKILDVLVSNGNLVSAKQPLIVMEAMKMEQTLRAPCDGIVCGLSVKTGDQVADAAPLLSIEEQDS